MRIRRKKNLTQRIDNVSDYIVITDKTLTNVNEAIKDKKYLDAKKLFGNDNEVDLEVGCGKGGFICEVAKKHAERNYIAVELIDNIIVSAAENAKNLKLNNILFINSGAEYLSRYIHKNSISNIYLNFSPPFPQKTHENRRLTNEKRLNDYSSFLKKDGKIFLKTDDKAFFDYSYKKLVECGFKVKFYDENDTGLDFLDVLTEYEKKFLQQQLKIYKLSAIKN